VDELRGESTPKIAGMDERVRRARRKIDREVQQYGTQRSGSWLDLGKSVRAARRQARVAHQRVERAYRPALERADRQAHRGPPATEDVRPRGRRAAAALAPVEGRRGRRGDGRLVTTGALRRVAATPEGPV
jgi:hypothetical protein